ncbi:MAG: 2-oxo acid dehydrogenase subunit E2, partial [Gammaproteobacteria bacterium]
VRAGPAARREARQLGVDITAVAGTGRRGTTTKDDVRRHVRARLEADAAGGTTAAALPDLAAFGPVRREPMSRLALTAARNLDRSASIIPHAWVMRRADVSLLEQARQRFRASQPAADAPLTLTALLCAALALTLRRFPRFNAAFDPATGELVYREYVHLGVAVDTERGLLVPVVRDAADRSVPALAAELQTLAQAARAGTLTRTQASGAGMTLTNLGGMGVNGIQPIVNWPEVAILGVAAGERHAVPGEDGGVAWRTLLPLTLGFDHRVINGADAARFLDAVVALLADPLGLALRP